MAGSRDSSGINAIRHFGSQPRELCRPRSSWIEVSPDVAVDYVCLSFPLASYSSVDFCNPRTGGKRGFEFNMADNSGMTGGLQTTLPVAMTVGAFTAIAWYCNIELNIMIWMVFKGRKGLYFYNLQPVGIFMGNHHILPSLPHEVLPSLEK